MARKHLQPIKMENGVGELLLHGVVGHELTAAIVREQLKAMGELKELRMLVNSDGGRITEGVAIYHVLRALKCKKVAVIEGIAASMASVIIMAADEVRIKRGAYIMVHNPKGGAPAESQDLRRAADLLDSMRSDMLDIYEARTGIERAELGRLLDEETYLSAEQSVSMGFADCIDDESAWLDLDAVAQLNPEKIPASLRALMRSEKMTEEEQAKMKALEEENARLKAALAEKESDEEAKAKAKAEGDDSEEEKKPTEEEEAAKAKAKAEADEEEAKAKAKAESDPEARLRAVEARQEASERAALYAGRPDITKEQRAALDKVPVAQAQAILATLPRMSSSPVAQARAALDVTATRGGDSPTGLQVTAHSPHAQLLDEKMGFAKPQGVTRNEGTQLILSAAGAGAARK